MALAEAMEKLPAFVVVEFAGEHCDQVGVLARCATAVRLGGGQLLACSHAGRVSCFEPGTVASGLLVARWPDRTAALASAEKYLLPLLPKHLGAGREPTIFVVDGLPVEGLPSLLDIPTVASVLPVTSPVGSVLMVIRGEAFDSSRMDIYRDMILPMMKLHGSYYEAFALSPGQVTTSAGRWDEQVFAISRWPSRKDAENFWFSDGYQTGAIPNRIGAGRFSVHVVEGL